jgi:fumarate reductase subunit C
MKGKEWVRPKGANWWLEKKPYTLYMVREVTALFMAGYAVFLLWAVHYAARGSTPFSRFVELLKSPVSIFLHLIALGMTLYHAVTWFGSTPKIAVLWRGEERVRAGAIILANYLALVVISAAVAGIALAVGRG